MDSERLSALKTLLRDATDEEVIHMHNTVRREFMARGNQRARTKYAKPGRGTTAHEWPDERPSLNVPAPDWATPEPMSEKTATTIFGNTHNPTD